MRFSVHILPIMKLTIENLAAEQGATAFKAGRPCQPVQDAAFMADLAPLAGAEQMTAVSAWRTGWDHAKQAATMAAMNGVALPA